MQGRIFIALALMIGMSAAPLGFATEAHHEPKPVSTTGAAQMASGEVRKVDKDAKKLTIKHGPIQNLDMPAMTMVFQVKDAAMLDQVTTGDKIRFSAEKIGGSYTVTGIEPVK